MFFTKKYNFSTFWRTIIHRNIVLKQFPLSISILGQKSCILGPTIFKIPQPNWHYLPWSEDLRSCKKALVTLNVPKTLTLIWFSTWRQVCHSNSPQTQIPALLIKAYKPEKKRKKIIKPLAKFEIWKKQLRAQHNSRFVSFWGQNTSMLWSTKQEFVFAGNSNGRLGIKLKIKLTSTFWAKRHWWLSMCPKH